MLFEIGIAKMFYFCNLVLRIRCFVKHVPSRKIIYALESKERLYSV